MNRRLNWVRHSARPLCLAAMILWNTCGCGKAPTGPAEPSSKSASEKTSDPDFAVPDGSSETIMKFVKDLRDKSVKQFENGQRPDPAYLAKMQRAMIEASDKILAQKSNDELLQEAASMKLGITISTGLRQQQQNPSQADAIAKMVLATVEQLRAHSQNVVVETANEFFIAARTMGIAGMSASERAKLVDEAYQMLISQKPSPRLHGSMDFLADQLGKVNENELAVKFLNQISGFFNESPDEQIKQVGRSFQSKANRLSLSLPGGKLEIEGALLDGSRFDWQSYRGKVVLVDFWATWCGPCVGELPNVKANYDEFHSRGFEVIGISLDRDRKELESFLKSNPIPWPQLFADPETLENGRSNPMAEKYSVSSIPTAFLVDREGKVVSTNARGPELRNQLTKLFD